MAEHRFFSTNFRIQAGRNKNFTTSIFFLDQSSAYARLHVIKTNYTKCYVCVVLCCLCLLVCVFCLLLNVCVSSNNIISYHSISYINNVNLSSFDLKIVIYGLKPECFRLERSIFVVVLQKHFIAVWKIRIKIDKINIR